MHYLELGNNLENELYRDRAIALIRSFLLGFGHDSLANSMVLKIIPSGDYECKEFSLTVSNNITTIQLKEVILQRL